VATRGASVTIDGLSRLRRDLRRAGSDMADLKAANRQVGSLILPEASARAPKGATGKLASSGRTSGRVAGVSLLFGGAAVPYAGPIHWGWPRRRIEAQPFAADAAAAKEPEWLDVYATELDRVLGRRIERVY
jgi:hypothetical protein